MKSPDSRKQTEIWFGEPLPEVCIVCGSDAGNKRSILFEKKLTSVQKLLEAAEHGLAFLANAILVPRIKSHSEIAKVLVLPLCDEHLQTGRLQERLGIVAGRSGSVLIQSAADQFTVALNDARTKRANQLGAQFTPRSESAIFLKSLSSEPINKENERDS